MAGRFPGAAGVDELWANLRAGVESIASLSDEELLAAGVSPGLLASPRYVRARGVLDGVELFDAPLFGFSPREAAITDPQHRVFLECAWEALEQAGVDPATFPGRIGVYAGSTLSTYLLFHLLPRMSPDDEASWQMVLANDKDTLATRVSYKLDLRGPSIAVQTACSTSLVAVHLARQALLDYECDVALAGGVAIRSPQTIGYLHQESGILSPDGHCRAFDAGARGTVFGGGAGIVVMRRLADAVADGDTVRAVVKGSAINNDGAQKAGFTAPSAEGQAEVVARALALAGVDPETVQYVETHGTATPLGDPIEIAGLTRAFRASSGAGSDAGSKRPRRGFCALGSIKTNVGHLDSAAGVAGLIKTVLALEHREIPPSLHFERPNPQIDFAASPFYVNDRLRPWEPDGSPRRAGVSSFGIGGTNAHVVLEEAPPPAPAAPATSASRPCQLLVLSAKTETALASSASRLAEHLGRHPEQELADVAHTLQVGRRALPWRRALVAGDGEEAIAALAAPGRPAAGKRRERTPSVAFLFPGQGSQRVGMGRAIYRTEPVFRRELDRAAEILRPHLGEDLRAILYPPVGREDEAARRLERTAIAQPALFAVETALARLWMSWGVRPQAMLGHSLGEVVAAHLAGVLSLEDALALVAFRGRLVEDLPGGAMLAVPLAESEVTALLGTELSLAAVNAPAQCVVSGPEPAVEALRAELAGRGVEGRRLATSHAFHSRPMDALLEPFARRVGEVALHPPEIPYLSNVCGRWVTVAEATDPAYWARHLRGTVRFAEGLAGLLAEPDRVLLEVGPGHALTRLARRQGEGPAVASLRAAGEDSERLGEDGALLAALGRLWTEGVPVDWAGFSAGERRRRVPLPTYPFERRRHWIPLARPLAGAAGVGLEEAAIDPQLEGSPESPEPAGAAPDSLLDPALDDPLARRIAAIWRQVLGVERVSAADRFFELGGDSLIALQVTARLRDAFGVELPVATLFDRPTIGGLRDAVEAALAARRRNLPAEAPAPISLGPTLCQRRGTDPAPLSFAQERLWFIDRLEGERMPYVLPVALRARGALRREVLAATLREIARRHETLRTRFPAVGGRPIQVIDPDWRPELPLVDLGGLPRTASFAELLRLVGAEQGPRFDLAAGPLVRATLVREAAEDFVLLVVMHHVISDGWSMGLLLRELAAIYPAFERGRPSPLAELPLQYADFAVWQRERLRGEALDEQLGYWTRQLAGLTPLALPTDRAVGEPPAGGGQRAGVAAFGLPQPLAERLHALASRQGASLFMVLLAVFQALISRLAGHDDVAVGTVVANRTQREIEGLIGFFVNTLVLRARYGGAPSFLDLLARVRETTLAAFDHQDLPFTLVVEALRPERRQGSTPLFDAMFTLQQQAAGEIALPGLRLAPLSRFAEVGVGVQSTLVLALTESPAEIAGTLAYDAARLDATTAARWRDQWLRLLAAALESPERPLGELPLLAESERHQVVAEWGDGAEIVLQGDLPAAIGVWGEICRAAAGGALVRTGRRGRRRANGVLEEVVAAGAALAAEPSAAAVPDQVPESVASARSELSRRLDGLSASKRELLAKRLSGQLAGAGRGPAADRASD